jgi:hypothetical protein
LFLALCSCFIRLPVVAQDPPPARAAAPPEAAPGPRLQALTEELRALYPDRASVEREGRRVAGRLLELARALEEAAPGGASAELRDAADAPLRDAARARLLAAEALALAGEEAAARSLLERLARERSGLDDERARALYLLGQGELLAERYLQARDGRPGAGDHFRNLVRRYPQSEWARRAARALRYVELLEGGPLPAIEAPFAPGGGGEPVPTSLASCRGSVVLIDFWKASTPGQRAFEEGLHADLAAYAAEHPQVAGRYQVLGVNLDTDRAAFEHARGTWKMPWPQCHDGLGFETPCALLLGIPRAPHWAVIDPRGRLVYLGADRSRFSAAFTREMERLRGE